MAKKKVKKKAVKEKTKKKKAAKKRALEERGKKVPEDVEKKIMEMAKGSGTTHSFSYSTVKTAGTRYSTAKSMHRR